MKNNQAKTQFHGIGRRKSAIARVWAKPGKGQIIVNGATVEEYFDTPGRRTSAVLPLVVTQLEKKIDIQVNVTGGGLNGQADAMKLGIARALLEANEELRGLLRENGLLTVDSRIKERKKPGQKGARKKFQFVKR